MASPEFWKQCGRREVRRVVWRRAGSPSTTSRPRTWCPDLRRAVKNWATAPVPATSSARPFSRGTCATATREKDQMVVKRTLENTRAAAFPAVSSRNRDRIYHQVSPSKRKRKKDTVCSRHSEEECRWNWKAPIQKKKQPVSLTKIFTMFTLSAQRFGSRCHGKSLGIGK